MLFQLNIFFIIMLILKINCTFYRIPLVKTFYLSTILANKYCTINAQTFFFDTI